MGEFEALIEGLILRASGAELDAARYGFKRAQETPPPGSGDVIMVVSSADGCMGFRCPTEDAQQRGRELLEFEPELRNRVQAEALLAVAIELELKEPTSKLPYRVSPIMWEVYRQNKPETPDGVVLFAHTIRRLNDERTLIFLSLVRKP